jgi:hypothetical protein
MAKRPPDCSMCDKRPLTPILRPDGTESSFLGCANCDDPKGAMPKVTDPT